MFDRLVTVTKSFAIVAALSSAGWFGIATNTAARAATSHEYGVVPIDGTKPDDPSYAASVNARGDVAGEELVSHVPFLYHSGVTTLLEPPKGVVDSSVVDLNYRDTIAIQARDGEGNAVAFAIEQIRGSFTWVRLGTGSLRVQNISVARVAGNGDVDGMVTLTSVSEGKAVSRAVVWHPHGPGKYSSAVELPLAPGYRQSAAGGMWSGNGLLFIGGDQWNSQHQVASFWSTKVHTVSFARQLPFISTMGGTNKKLFVGGTTYDGSESYAWIARVQMPPSGDMTLRSPRTLPVLGGFDEDYGESVNVDNGSVVMVGEVTNSAPQMNIRGVMWTNGKVQALDSLIGGSKWQIVGAAGINQSGDIAGEGIYKGTDHAVLILPSRSR